ncbi:MAG: ubiquinone/menaquinone biosynthesis methyltransferase [Ignavibacteriales bacterium]|nr:ubiquinone/menaquinone biosynthesis methyltransferase [Ignavibacteriales bacterium]
MSEKKKQVQTMFDAIAVKYDFLNHFLSAGVDYYWRKKAIALTGFSKDAELLDLACGTGDFAYTVKKLGVTKIVGADLSMQMLKLFGAKFDWIKAQRVQTVAEWLPFLPGSFTNITVAFGVRNFYDIPKAFSEFHSVLKPNGKATVLEFCMPKNPLIASLYRFYFKNILPVVGRIVSGSNSAYTYLLDKEIDLVKLFREAGFQEVYRKNLTFGLVQVVIAKK